VTSRIIIVGLYTGQNMHDPADFELFLPVA